MTLTQGSEINYENYLYDKTYTCPCCNNIFKTRALKISKLIPREQDSDFFNHYEPINPLVYDAVLCSKCGYCCVSKLFEKKLYKNQIKAIITTITPSFKPKIYSNVYDLKTGLERLKLALVSTITKNAKSSEKAFVIMKIAWMYRLLGDTKSENAFLESAYKEFVEAFSTEDLPIFGMNQHAMEYLIAELARKTNRYSEAILMFGKIITSPNATNEIKDLARKQKDLIPIN